MPKHARSSSSSHNNRYSNPMPVSLAPAANQTPEIYHDRLSMQGYYTMPSGSASMQPQPQPAYDPYSTSAAASAAASAPSVTVPPVQHRASSGAWTPQDDEALLAARAQGLNWAQIQINCFGNKTPNACRKRHERLMERKGADDWDNRKLERLAKEYMGMRKEIWSGLASRTGEKWNVVEAKCMSNGLKNLQGASRAASRRERVESGQPLPTGYDDDSGISGIGLTPVDELDPSYSSPEAASSAGGSSGGAPSIAGYPGSRHHAHPQHHHHHSHSHPHQQHHFNMQPMHSGQYYAPPGHGYSSSVSSSASGGSGGYGAPGHHGTGSQSPSPYLHPHVSGQRLSSADMGIESIINRPGRAPQPM